MDGLCVPAWERWGKWIIIHTDNQQARATACRSHVSTRSPPPTPRPAFRGGGPSACFQTTSRPASALRSVLPATRCPQAHGASGVRASSFPLFLWLPAPGIRAPRPGPQTPEVSLSVLPGESAREAPGRLLGTVVDGRPGL